MTNWNNTKDWEKSSNEWVATMHKSRLNKEKKSMCNHDDFGWCKNCLTTVDGEKLKPV